MNNYLTFFIFFPYSCQFLYEGRQQIHFNKKLVSNRTSLVVCASCSPRYSLCIRFQSRYSHQCPNPGEVGTILTQYQLGINSVSTRYQLSINSVSTPYQLRINSVSTPYQLGINSFHSISSLLPSRFRMTSQIPHSSSLSFLLPSWPRTNAWHHQLLRTQMWR